MSAECYFHSGKPTVAGCSNCGKGLCRECATYWEPPSCSGCVEKQLNRERSHVIGLVVKTSICFIIAIFLPINSAFFIISFTGIPAIYSAASLKDPLEESVIFAYYFWWWYLVKLVIAFLFGSLGFVYIVYKIVNFQKKEKAYKELFSQSPNYQLSTADAIAETAEAPQVPQMPQMPQMPQTIVPSVSNLSVGSAVYAQFSLDNWFYYATVEAINGDQVTVRFFDNVVETLPSNRICDIDFALSKLNPHSNMDNTGHYYQCSIDHMDAGDIVVNYEGNQKQERVGLEKLRFTAA